MRVSFVSCISGILVLSLSESLSGLMFGGNTRTMGPHTSPPPHASAEESCCSSCMLETLPVPTEGQWVLYLQFSSPNDSGSWSMCTATNNSAGVCHQDTAPTRGAASLDTPRDRADAAPAAGPAPERRRGTAGPQSLPSPVQSSVPHMPDHVREANTARWKNTQWNLCNMSWASRGQATPKSWWGCGSASVLSLHTKEQTRCKKTSPASDTSSLYHIGQNLLWVQPSQNSHCSVSSNSNTTKEALTNQLQIALWPAHRVYSAIVD